MSRPFVNYFIFPAIGILACFDFCVILVTVIDTGSVILGFYFLLSVYTMQEIDFGFGSLLSNLSLWVTVGVRSSFWVDRFRVCLLTLEPIGHDHIDFLE